MKRSALPLFLIWHLLGSFSLALPKYSLMIPSFQADCPVQTIAAGTSTTYFLNGTLIQNASKSTLVQVKFGLLAIPNGQEQPFWKETSTAFEVNVPHLGTEAIWTFPWLTHEILSLAELANIQRFRFHIGIVYALFADGSSYYHDLEGGYFPVEQLDPMGLEAWEQVNENAPSTFIEQAAARSAQNHKERPLRTFANGQGEINKFEPENGPSFCCSSTSSMLGCHISIGGEGCTVSMCSNCNPAYYPCPISVCCQCQVCDVVPCQ